MPPGLRSRVIYLLYYIATSALGALCREVLSGPAEVFLGGALGGPRALWTTSDTLFFRRGVWEVVRGRHEVHVIRKRCCARAGVVGGMTAPSTTLGGCLRHDSDDVRHARTRSRSQLDDQLLRQRGRHGATSANADTPKRVCRLHVISAELCAQKHRWLRQHEQQCPPQRGDVSQRCRLASIAPLRALIDLLKKKAEV